MIYRKTEEQVKIMREGGAILARIRDDLARAVKVGLSLKELDELAYRLIQEAGAEPAFLGYRPPWAEKAYPASICSSVNEVVVHCIPNERQLREGDVLAIDVAIKYKGWHTDTAITVGVGRVSDLANKLIKVTKECLDLAILECRFGKTLGDVGFVIERHAKKNGFMPVKGLTGHGIGRELHEEPTVYNEGRRGRGLMIEEGMVLAIEPMLSVGGAEVMELPDESFATKDGSISAHFEHTVAITHIGPAVLTYE